MSETNDPITELHERVLEELGEESAKLLDSFLPEMDQEREHGLILHVGGTPDEAASVVEEQLEQFIPAIYDLFEHLTVVFDLEGLSLIADACAPYADCAAYATDGLMEQAFSVMDDGAVSATHDVANAWLDGLRASMVGMHAHEQVALAATIAGALLDDIYGVCRSSMQEEAA